MDFLQQPANTEYQRIDRVILKANKIRPSQVVCFCYLYNILIIIKKLTVQKISCTKIYQIHAKIRY